MFGLLYGLQALLGLDYLFSVFVTFFVIVLLRGLFESAAVRDVPVHKLQPQKFLLLAFWSSIILCPILYLLKQPFGEWSVIIAIAFSSKIILWLRKKIFLSAQNGDEEPRRLLLMKKLPLYTQCLYGFFGGLAVLTYAGVKVWGIDNFSLIFAAGLFIALIPHMILEWILVFEQRLAPSTIGRFCCAALVGTVITTALLCIMIQGFGMAGKAATISAMILLKLVQPWFVKPQSISSQ